MQILGKENEDKMDGSWNREENGNLWGEKFGQ